jgi:hypothetical protein
VPDEDPDAVAEELRSLGWRVFVLPDDIDDVWALRDALSKTFPLNPPLGPGVAGTRWLTRSRRAVGH